MKIYYEFEPTDNELADKFLIAMFEKNKYELMWTLRSIENDINYEGGMIIMTTTNGKSGIYTKGFTRSTIDKIMELIRNSNFPSPFLPGMPSE